MKSREGTRIQLVSEEQRRAFGAVAKRELRRIGLTQEDVAATMDVGGLRICQLLGPDLMDSEQIQRFLRGVPNDRARIAIHAAYVRFCVPQYVGEEEDIDVAAALETASFLDRVGLPDRALARLRPRLRDAPRELVGKVVEKIARLDLRLARLGRASDTLVAAEREVGPVDGTYEGSRFDHVHAAILSRGSMGRRAALPSLSRALASARKADDSRATKRAAATLCDEAKLLLAGSRSLESVRRAAVLAEEALGTFGGGRPAVLARIVLGRAAAIERRWADAEWRFLQAEERLDGDLELRLELLLARAVAYEALDGADAASARYESIAGEAEAVGDVHHRNVAEARRTSVLLDPSGKRFG